MAAIYRGLQETKATRLHPSFHVIPTFHYKQATLPDGQAATPVRTRPASSSCLRVWSLTLCRRRRWWVCRQTLRMRTSGPVLRSGSACGSSPARDSSAGRRRCCPRRR